MDNGFAEGYAVGQGNSYNGGFGGGVILDTWDCRDMPADTYWVC